MFKAKRNIIYGGKLFDKGKSYDLTEDEQKNIGVDFEGVKATEEPTEDESKDKGKDEKPKKDEKKADDKGKSSDEEEKKATRK